MLSKYILLPLLLVNIALASDVLEYHDSDFDSKISAHDIALVEFYAPWCGHCKHLAPEYEKAATVLKNNDPPVPLIKVDCTAEQSTCSRFGVSGYPTLKIFKGGQISSDYNGPREADGIVKYMRVRAGPTAKPLETVADVEKFLNNNDHSIVGFFSSDKSDLFNEFRKAADQLSERFRFGYSTNQDVLNKYNHKDQVVIYQPPRLQVKLEPTENVYSGEASSSAIKSFVESEVHGVCGHRTSGNTGDFKGPVVIVYYNVDYTKDAKGTNYVRNRIIKVAQKLKSESLKVKFAIANSEDFRNELTEFGVSDIKPDGKYITGRGSRDEKFKFDGEYSVENLEQFARDLEAGKLEVHMKSEPIPASNDEPVKVLVARNFDQIITDDKDALIEFYAPWCGHCKTLAPKYDELAAKLKDEKEIVIAKMDATANDVPPQFEVRGFPTLYYVPKGQKNSPRRYEGGREVDDFIKYLAKEATNELSGWDRNGKKQKKKAGKPDL